MEGKEGHNRAIEFGKHNQPLEQAAVPWERREGREQHDPLSGMGVFKTGRKPGRDFLKISMNGCVVGGWMASTLMENVRILKWLSWSTGVFLSQ